MLDYIFMFLFNIKCELYKMVATSHARFLKCLIIFLFNIKCVQAKVITDLDVLDKSYTLFYI